VPTALDVDAVLAILSGSRCKLLARSSTRIVDLLKHEPRGFDTQFTPHVRRTLGQIISFGERLAT
jgi:hypothetical protein